MGEMIERINHILDYVIERGPINQGNIKITWDKTSYDRENGETEIFTITRKIGEYEE